MRRGIVTLYSSSLEAVKDIHSGALVACGGFGSSGVPENLLEALSTLPVMQLTAITNNCSINDYGLDLLLQNRQLAKVISSFIGDNKNFLKQYLAGEIESEITPQGSIAEKLRAGGAGIPAFYTKSGYGTIISEGGFPMKFSPGGKWVEKYSEKKICSEFEGEMYVLERSIRPDFALIKAWKADKLGNLVYAGAAQNFNPVYAAASKVTIAEVEEIVEIGELQPSEIHTPGVYVHRLVKGEKYRKPIDVLKFYSETIDSDPIRQKIAKRTARELNNGMTVNLGIGIPTMVTHFVDSNVALSLQSENGILGMGPYPSPGEENPDLVNAGKEAVTLVPGASLFSSAESFAMIRGGHIDATVLGALQVSQRGDLANWSVPGKFVKGIGGAMDLVASAKLCIVAMEHTVKGQSKVLENCDLPLTGVRCVDLLVTERGVFDFRREGMTLIDLAKGTSLDELENLTEAKFSVASDLKSSY